MDIRSWRFLVSTVISRSVKAAQKDFDKKILGKSQNRFVLAFNKFTIPDDKVFEIEMFESLQNVF